MPDFLFEQIVSKENLKKAWFEVRSGSNTAGIDQITIIEYQKELDLNLIKLAERLENRTYIPKPVLEVKMQKDRNKFRNISIASLEDRIVQRSFTDKCSAIADKNFYDFSFAYRKGKGHKNVIEMINSTMQKGEFHKICAGDITSFFDNIDHEILVKKFKYQVSSEQAMIWLLRLWLTNDYLSSDRQTISNKTKGVHQGFIVSPLLSNIYLNDFDKYWNNKDYLYIRYSDNFIFLTNNSFTSDNLYQKAKELMADLKLQLNDKDYQKSDYKEGFTFLGVFFRNGILRISDKKYLKATQKIHKIINKCNTVESSGIMIRDINKAFYSWKYYYSMVSEKEQLKKFDNFVASVVARKLKNFGVPELNDALEKLDLFTKEGGKRPDAEIDKTVKAELEKLPQSQESRQKESRKFYKKEVHLRGEWLILNRVQDFP